VEARPGLLDILTVFPSCKPDLAHLLEALPALTTRFYSLCCSPSALSQAQESATGTGAGGPPCYPFAFSLVRQDMPEAPRWVPGAERAAGGAPGGVRRGRVFKGVCTNWMEQLLREQDPAWVLPGKPSAANLGGVPGGVPTGLSFSVYPRSGGNFSHPGDLSAPVIMIGPGTGVAPFRGFLQEREVALGEASEGERGERGESWLSSGAARGRGLAVQGGPGGVCGEEGAVAARGRALAGGGEQGRQGEGEGEALGVRCARDVCLWMHMLSPTHTASLHGVPVLGRQRGGGGSVLYIKTWMLMETCAMGGRYRRLLKGASGESLQMVSEQEHECIGPGCAVGVLWVCRCMCSTRWRSTPRTSSDSLPVQHAHLRLRVSQHGEPQASTHAESLPTVSLAPAVGCAPTSFRVLTVSRAPTVGCGGTALTSYLISPRSALTLPLAVRATILL